MKVIAVVGSASGSGKTKLACAILRAIPGLGAVKISPRAGPPRVEWGAGDAGKDTDRFAASGASLVARIVAPRARVTEAWAGVRASMERLPGVVVEGAGALALPAERFTVLVVTPQSLGERPARDLRLAVAADCIVVVEGGGASSLGRKETTGPLGKSVPVVSVTKESESWADEALLRVVRNFLLCSGKEDPR
jgi:hypothetical protein